MLVQRWSLSLSGSSPPPLPVCVREGGREWGIAYSFPQVCLVCWALLLAMNFPASLQLCLHPPPSVRTKERYGRGGRQTGRHLPIPQAGCQTVAQLEVISSQGTCDNFQGPFVRHQGLWEMLGSDI